MRMLGCVDISFWGGPQLVQDMLRYMFANPVKVVHFKGVVQLRTGAPDAIFHSNLLQRAVSDSSDTVSWSRRTGC